MDLFSPAFCFLRLAFFAFQVIFATSSFVVGYKKEQVFFYQQPTTNNQQLRLSVLRTTRCYRSSCTSNLTNRGLFMLHDKHIRVEVRNNLFTLKGQL